MVIPLPRPSFLDDQESLGHVRGERRWRSPDRKRLYTYDSLHGEIEVFNQRGYHLGTVDIQTGEYRKPPVRGRKIDV